MINILKHVYFMLPNRAGDKVYHGSSPFLITCNGLLTDKWVSIVHLISNVYEWVGNEGIQFTECVHPTLAPEEKHSKKWLRGSQDA